MAAYYSENDEKAAAWLRELIRQGLVADGEVDTRSIEDVRPADLVGFDQCHFFAGIGGWSYALRLAGWPDDRHVWTGSCPCQPFSTAGKSDVFADERHLWPAWYWLIDERRPVVVFGEQVESPAARTWLDLVSTDLEAAGYAVGPSDLPVAGVGAPGIRQRLFWVADSTGGRCGTWTGPAPEGLPEYSQLPSDVDRAVGGLAVGRGERREGQRLRLLAGESRYADAEVGWSGEAGRLADESSGGLGIDGRASGNTGHADQRVTAGRLGDAGLSPGRAELEHEPWNGARRIQTEADATGVGPSGVARGVGHSLITRLEGHTGHGGGGYESRRLDPDSARSVAATGATRGPWAGADWLLCRDDKFRPVEPGTFPLAHGIPARVGRLRGYGNAINPQVAAAFIEAYCEARGIDVVRT